MKIPLSSSSSKRRESKVKNKSVVDFAELNFLKLNAAKTYYKYIIIKPKILRNQKSKSTSKMLRLVEGKILGVYLPDTL
jgi:hypothetical protein